MKIEILKRAFTNRQGLDYTYSVFVNDKFKKEFQEKENAEKYAEELRLIQKDGDGKTGFKIGR